MAAARGGHARKLATFAALFLSSALLHAAEVAITTLYPWKVKEFAEAEPSTGVFTMLDRDITRVLYTLLVCSTACTVCGTALAASALAELCAGAPRRAAAATLGFAAGSIFLGELLPKTLAVANAERVARRAQQRAQLARLGDVARVSHRAAHDPSGVQELRDHLDAEVATRTGHARDLDLVFARRRTPPERHEDAQ